MRSETIQTLSATPPPKAKLKFYNVREANKEIARLEAELANKPAASASKSDVLISEPSTPASTKVPTETEKCLASVAFRKKHGTAIEVAKLRAAIAQSSGITRTALETKLSKLQAK